MYFHFRTLRLQQDGSLDEANLQDSVIDDSRAMGSDPFELLVGREFKLEVWEEVVKTMRVGEVARFRCPFKVRFLQLSSLQQVLKCFMCNGSTNVSDLLMLVNGLKLYMYSFRFTHTAPPASL